MYLQFFGLSEAPFSITPDPAFVYLSAAHRDALAHLLYGVGKGGAGGFVQLTGEVGTGKTTICRCLLEQIPEDTQIALILNPMVTPIELLATICEELGIPTDGISHSSKLLIDGLNVYLLDQHAQGKRVVVVIDEAQNLSPEALEQVRLLTNLETAKHKLLQMVLLGQPELRQLLQRQSLRQLAQRITARYHLAPLAEQETCAYVRHRVKVGGARHSLFKRSALHALHERSGGVPRLINIIADRALVGAYAAEATQVTARLVHAAADEVQPSEGRVSRRAGPWAIAAAGAMGVAALGFFLWQWQVLPQQSDPVQPHSAAAVAQPSAPDFQPQPDPQSQPQSVAADAELPQPSVSPAGRDSPGTAAAGNLAFTPASGGMGRSVSGAVVAGALDQDWLDLQNSRAWGALESLWNKRGGGEAVRRACEERRATGFACVQDKGSWSRINRLGLPVILVLQQPDRRHVVLSGMDQQHVLLGAREDQRLVPRERVEAVWMGEYFVAWPQPIDWPGEIRRGDSGRAVDIVLEMATMADEPWQQGTAFNASFESWLLTFQRQHGLVADGIIGPQTLLYLMAPTITEPRLTTLLKERS